MNPLLRSNLVVGTGTALSRLTGLLRVAVLVYVLGRTALADVYVIANETPNIVFDLLLGGVLSATLVPLFTSFLVDEDDEATDVVLTVGLTLVALSTMVAVLAAPLIFGIYAVTPSAAVDSDTLRQVGTLLTRIFLVQILFYGLVAMANAVLNSRRRFFAAAWSPVLANLVIIASLLSLPSPGNADWQIDQVLDDDRLRWTLGLGATLGIATMALVLIPALWRAGLRYRPRWDWRHPAVGRLVRLSGWTFGFVAANQLALVVVRNLAEPGSGDAAAYVVAFTFFVLPHGLLAVSLSTTFQPEMARAVAEGDRPGFIHHTSLGIRLTALLVLPAAALMFLLRRPIIGLSLERGAFGAEDAMRTADALGGFAIGLVGFSIFMFALRGFYAHQDTRTPFIMNVGENAVNIVAALVLVGWFGVVGLTVAFSLAYLVAAVGALIVLGRRFTGFPLAAIAGSITRMLVATGAMVAVVLALDRVAVGLVEGDLGDDTGWGALARIALATVAGLATYLGALFVVRAPEVGALRQRVAGRSAR